jgi:hypothetical protein
MDYVAHNHRCALLTAPYFYAPLQHVDLAHAARVASEAILTALTVNLCTIVQANFGELTFHALG